MQTNQLKGTLIRGDAAAGTGPIHHLIQVVKIDELLVARRLKHDPAREISLQCLNRNSNHSPPPQRLRF